MASIFDLLQKALNNATGAVTKAASSATPKETYEGHARAGSSYTPPRLLSDPKARNYFQAKASQPQRRAPGLPSPAVKPERSGADTQTVERDIEDQRIDWRANAMSNLRKTAPAPSNPFGKPLDESDPKLNRPAPSITPEIRAMASQSFAFDSALATPDYIKDLARADGDLSRRLAKRYLDEYSLGRTPDQPKETLDELTKLSIASEETFKGKGAASIIPDFFKTVDALTRAPQEIGGKAILASAADTNYKIKELPTYYYNLATGAPNQASLQPETDKAKHEQYMAEVERYQKASSRFDTLSKLATFSDGLNSILSLPSMYTAQQKGLDVRTAQQEVLGATGSVQQNILQTGEQAGIIPFADAATFVNKLLDRGLTLDDDDLRTYRTGWSPEQYQKYDQQLRAQGTSLAQIVMEDGLTWPQLKDTLDLMHFDGAAQADIARSLGFVVVNEDDEDVVKKTLTGVDQNRQPRYVEDVVGQRHVFDVADPNQRVYYDDLKKADFDLGALGLENTASFADLVMTKHAVATLGRSKTAMFQDFMGSLLTDPTNFGPLQMVWKPMGVGIEALGEGAKTAGKAAVKLAGLAIDIPLGVETTLGKLVRRGGDTVEKMTRADWTRGTDYLRYLGSETAQGAMWKEKNALFFGLQSALKPGTVKDGAAAIKLVDEYLPRLQEAARSGDWGVFVREVTPGSARSVAQSLNAAGDNLVRIASDEDALGHFIENFAGSFKDDLSKIEHDQLGALAKQGDTAGLMKWSVERRLSELGHGVEAEQAIDLNDVFNHVTNSYGAGVQVLAEKKLGTYGKELASPSVKKVNEILNGARRVWTQALLSARPGYNIINYFDNAMRLAANGYNPVMSAYDIETELLNHMSPAQLRNELGVEMRAMTESVQDVMYVPESVITAAQKVRTVLKDGGDEAIKKANKYVTEMRAATNGLPNIVKSELDKRINAVNLAISKYESGVGTLTAVSKALNEVENTLFMRQAGADRFFQPVSKTLSKTPREALTKMKEYGDLIRNGGNLVKGVYDDFIGLAQSAHQNIEAAAKMRVYGAEYLDRYQKYVSQIPIGNIPDIGNPQVQQALNEALHEAVLSPSKFADAQAILERAAERKSVPDAVRNWLVSLMPSTPDGIRPLSDPLITKMANWMTTELLAHPEQLRDPDAILSLMNRGQKYAEARATLEAAEPAVTERVALLNTPTNRVPDFMANELSLGGASTPDPSIVIARLETIQQQQMDAVQRILDSYVDVLHEPYNLALDQLQQKLPRETRLHRYEAMRDSFVDKFKGEAVVGGKKVEVTGVVVSGKKTAPEAILSDGMTVHIRDVKMTDPFRQQYFESYKLWDATKESTDMLNKSGVARSIPGSGIEIGYDTGFVKAVPADVARDYTRKLEADLQKHGIELPKTVEIGRGAGSRRVNLSYDTPEDLIRAFNSGSGLMVQRERNANVFEALNRVTDNWLTAERLTGSTSVEQLSNVKIGGKTVAEYMVAKRLDPKKPEDMKRVVEMILDERSEAVTIKLRPGQTISNKVGNKVTAPLSLRENSAAYWEKYAREVVGETRGQWIPVFDPNAPDGAKIVFKKLDADTPLVGAQIPLDTGSVIPDQLTEHYAKVEDAKEALEEAADAINVEYTSVADDFVPEQTVNVEAEIAQVADQPEPYAAFSEKYPRLRSADDLVQRIAYLNARGATDITPEQAKDLATLLQTLSSTMLGGDDPDRLIKAMNFTDVFPRELGGELYQTGRYPLYSKLQEASATLGQPKATPDQWLAHLKKSGVKDAELNNTKDALGQSFPDWLKSHDGPVSAEDVRAWTAENQIKVEEVELVQGGDNSILEKANAINDAYMEKEFEAADFLRQRNALTDEEYYQDDGIDRALDRFISDNSDEQHNLITKDAKIAAELADSIAKYKQEHTDAYVKYRASGTKFDNYTVPGGTNYREIVLTLPSESTLFESEAHWPGIKNPIGHIRGYDMTDDAGRQIWVVDEIQSDWAQAIREAGGPRPTKLPDGWKVKASTWKVNGNEVEFWRVFDDEGKVVGQSRLGEKNAIEAAIGNFYPTNPIGMPFEKNADEVLTKRAIAWATINGYDAVAFLPGDVHVSRWGTERISWQTVKDGSKQIDIRPFTNRFNPEQEAQIAGQLGIRPGFVQVNSIDGVKEAIDSINSIAGYNLVDPKIANKLWEKVQSSADGVYEPRGDGLRYYYDTKIPNVVNDISKKNKFGSKLVDGVVVGTGDEVTRTSAKILDITDDMRQSISYTGLPLFQQYGEKIMGLTKVSRELNTVMVGLFKGSNIDTALEETAHAISAILQMPKDILGKEFEVVRDRFADDMEIIHQVCGAPLVKSETGRPQYTMFQKSLKLYEDTPENIAKANAIRNQARLAEERWAEYVRVYLQKGTAPAKLKEVFERFKAWLAGVFKAKYTSGDKVPVRLKMVLDSWIEQSPEWAKQYNLAVDTLKGVKPETVAKFKEQADILHGLIDQINGGESVAKFRQVIDETVAKLNNVGSAAISKDVKAEGDLLDGWLSRMQQINSSVVTEQLEPLPDDIVKLSDAKTLDIAKSIGASLEDVDRAVATNDEEIVNEAYKILEQKLQAMGMKYEKSPEKTRKAIDQWVVENFKGADVVNDSYVQKFLDDGRSRLTPAVDKTEQLNSLMAEMEAAGYNFKTEDDLINALAKFDIENTTSQADVNFGAVMSDFWHAFSEVISDGEFEIPSIDNAGNITRRTGDVTTASFKRGPFKPTVTLDQALRQERVGPLSLDELAALNAPKTVYISPERKVVLQYEEAVREYLAKFYGDVENAVRKGHVPQLEASQLSPENAEMVRQWLEMSYGQIQDAAGRAQAEAAQKMRTVMMDFNTTYNLDVFMQQGPTLPKWTGVGGLQPLAVGGIVPFFKFPRMNIESWVNTLSNHPVVLHNVAKYNAAANRERASQGMSEQFLPSWPVRIGDQVYSVSPFGFMSLSQLLRPMNPYMTEDSSDIAQAISVAQQAGFSLGPTARIMTMALGVAPDVAIQSIIPQGSALIDPNSPVGRSIINNAPIVAKLIGLTTSEDEFGIQKQMVLDAFADMKNVSAAKRESIYSDLMLALSTNQSARRTNAEEKYRQLRFEQSNTGYWTGVYPRPYSTGETDRLDYKQSIADITAAMDAVGLTPEQKDKLTSQMMGDPRRMVNTQYGALYKAYLPGDVTAFTEDEAKRNEISRRAQLNEYYQQVGELQAQFQQKYGLSGTPIPQAESDKFYAELKLLNTKYADALQPSSVKRYAGQSDADYQYQLGQSWLEYLKDSKPKMSQFPTYAEYERAVEQWYTDLHKTSAGMWELTSSLVGRKDPLPPYLAEVSTKAIMRKFESQYDTASDAIYRVYTDNYYSGYWDALNGKSGPERLLADMEYKSKYPTPSNKQIVDMVRADEVYAKRFSNAQLYQELGAHPVASIEERYQFGRTIPERQAIELSNLLALIPPGNAYFKWRDSLDKDIQKHLQTYQDAGYKALPDTKWWVATYEAVKSSIENKFDKPDIATVREWVQASKENKQMEAERDRLAPGFSAILTAYNAIDYADKAGRAAYRKANPEIGAYYDWLYNTWAKNHPVWAKYYGSDTTATASSTGYSAQPGVSYPRKSYSRGGGGYSYGGGGSYSSGSGYSASAQSYDKNWQPFQDFRRMAGDQLYGRLNDYLSGRIQFTTDETGLLQQLYKQYPFGAKDYDSWLNNVLPSMISRFIPGHDFFKNPTYYSDAYPIKHYNKDLYWFDKTKNAR